MSSSNTEKQGGREPIKVYALHFPSNDSTSGLPGASSYSSTTLKSSAADPGSHLTIEFIPWLRHYRCVHTPHGEGAVPVVYFIHEQRPRWVQWIAQ